MCVCVLVPPPIQKNIPNFYLTFLSLDKIQSLFVLVFVLVQVTYSLILQVFLHIHPKSRQEDGN